MGQKTIDNGQEFIVETNGHLTEDSIIFKDNNDNISISIDNSNGEEATYILYKKNTSELHKWLKNHSLDCKKT